MNCEQEPSCPNPGKYKLYWPGSPAIIVCEVHTKVLLM